MSKISIVTDSTADIPEDLARTLGITVVPLTINFHNKTYLDRVDITNEEFYDLLYKSDTLPTTSQPAPSDFVEVYRRLYDAGTDIIFSIHISSHLSGTVNGASMAARTMGDGYDIRVFDSLSATVGLGLLVTTVAQKVLEGASPQELENFLMMAIKNMKIYFLLDSLDNLEKGGRIGKASYLVGSILNIKPILELSRGEISVYKKIRGNKGNRSLMELAKSVLNDVDASQSYHSCIGYNNNHSNADQLTKLIGQDLHLKETDHYQLGSVVTTHIGFGAIGVAFFNDKEC